MFFSDSSDLFPFSSILGAWGMRIFEKKRELCEGAYIKYVTEEHSLFYQKASTPRT